MFCEAQQEPAGGSAVPSSLVRRHGRDRQVELLPRRLKLQSLVTISGANKQVQSTSRYPRRTKVLFSSELEGNYLEDIVNTI